MYGFFLPISCLDGKKNIFVVYIFKARGSGRHQGVQKRCTYLKEAKFVTSTLLKSPK